jgi:iron complex outermembrane receptor protein
LRRYTNFFDPASIVTKKALDQPYYALQQQFGNYDQYRTTALATSPVDEDGSLKYRLDLAYQDLESFKRFVNDERVFIAPKLSWTPNDRFEANFELEYKFEDRVNDFGIPVIGNRPAPVPLNTFLGDGAKGQKMNSVVVAFDWAFKLNDDWQIKNRFLHEDWDINYFDAQPDFMINDRELARFAVTGQAFHETYATNLDLLGKFDLY